jgi:ferredoxin-NADP reductase
MTHPALAIRNFEVNELVWETPDIFTLRLRPKAAEDKFHFLAGQWVYLQLLNDDGSLWARAAFSVLSSPANSRDMIELGIKVYGDFTKRAAGLVPGDMVSVQGPFGVFTLDESDAPMAMFAAGIGVSPLLCMMQDLADKKSMRPVTFFYSNKTVEDIAYFERLRELKKIYSNLNVVQTLTQKTYQGWDGETGRISGEMIKKHVTDLNSAKYYLCGPLDFMESIKAFLSGEGVDVKACVKQERFD